MSDQPGITDEMEEYFIKRTDNHVNLVNKYAFRMMKLDEISEVRRLMLLDSVVLHDDSKYNPPEKIPYIYITWQYRMKDKGEKFEIPKEIDGSAATLHHITTNRHHPEFHQKDRVDVLNREDRDGIPSKIVDASDMPDVDVAEMVADWCAMSEEKNNTPREWADKVIDKRWKFSSNQKELIYSLIDSIWSPK